MSRAWLALWALYVDDRIPPREREIAAFRDDDDVRSGATSPYGYHYHAARAADLRAECVAAYRRGDHATIGRLALHVRCYLADARYIRRNRPALPH